MAPTFSVIIPARNAARTIGACLDSVAALDPPALEVIVADDASTDDTGTIAASRGAVVVRLDANVGPGLARNAAARRARGEFLAFTDADCTVPTDWLGRFMRAFSEGTYSAMSGPYAGTNDTRFLTRLIDHYLRFSQSRIPDEIDASISSNLCVRAHDFFEAGGFPEYTVPGETMPYFGNEDEELAHFLVKATGKPVRWLRENGVFHAYRATLPRYFKQQALYAEAILVSYARFPTMMTGRSNYSRGGGAASVISTWLAAGALAGALRRPVFALGVLPFLAVHAAAVRHLATAPPSRCERVRMGLAAYPFLAFQALAWSKGLASGAIKSARGWRAWRREPAIPPPLAR